MHIQVYKRYYAEILKISMNSLIIYSYRVYLYTLYGYIIIYSYRVSIDQPFPAAGGKTLKYMQFWVYIQNQAKKYIPI